MGMGQPRLGLTRARFTSLVSNFHRSYSLSRNRRHRHGEGEAVLLHPLQAPLPPRRRCRFLGRRRRQRILGLRARPRPRPQFVTKFDPSQTLTPAAAPTVIAPLPNSGHFLSHCSRKPTSLPTPEEAALTASAGGGPTFVLDTSTTPDNPSSHVRYGLTVHNAAATESEQAPPASAATESEKTPPPPLADAPSGDLMLRRYKEDMASLPDHRGIDEFREVPVEGFGALLAGYGWLEGKGIGRNNKTGDTKVVEYDCRAGTQGLGYNPSEADPKKTRSGDWIVGGKKATDNGNAKNRDRDSRDRTEERGSSAQQKRSGEWRAEREVQEKEGNARDSQEGKSGVGNKVRWLQSHIRVRVVSERLSKRLYLMKGKVVDVVGLTTCDIVMDDESELVQGVEQDMLETVLPRTNGRVLVLYGKHKRVYRHLVEKNSEEEIGVVEDADTKDMIRVKYDQIAEYVEDPELIGYRLFFLPEGGHLFTRSSSTVLGNSSMKYFEVPL